MPADRLTHSGAPRPATGIVHLGLGAFFRAFGCVYIADAMAASGGDWGIVGVSLRSPGMRDALQPQGWAYTSVTLGPNGEDARVIEVLNDVLVAPEDPGAVLDAMADPGVRIVTLTVTEKGYCHNPATGRLNMDHPDIRHDLSSDQPVSAIGFLVRALQRRRDAGLAPFTVLTCDNLPENGKMLRGLVLEFAQALDPALADWIASEGRFPSTMVDRITPATTDDLKAEVADQTGYEDASPVPTEPFSEWVISGKFVAGHPDWASAGARFVDDVVPFEERKLWLLNGSHSLLAYAGQVRGHETVSEAINDELCREWVNSWWDDACANLSLPADHLAEYRAALLDRFENPRMHHALAQIGTDGSLKIPVRIVPTFKLELEQNRNALGAARAVAAWYAFLRSGKWIKDVAAETVADLVAVEDEQEAVERLLAWLSPELVGSASLVLEQAGALTA